MLYWLSILPNWLISKINISGCCAWYCPTIIYPFSDDNTSTPSSDYDEYDPFSDDDTAKPSNDYDDYDAFSDDSLSYSFE